MPFYQFTVVEDSPSARKQAEIARAVTEIHTRITGSDPTVVTCSFVVLPADSLFEGGEPTTGPRLIGTVRRRPEAVLRRLIEELARGWVAVTGEPYESVVVFLNAIPGYQAFERGRFMPEADAELELVSAQS